MMIKNLNRIHIKKQTNKQTWMQPRKLGILQQGTEEARYTFAELEMPSVAIPLWPALPHGSHFLRWCPRCPGTMHFSPAAAADDPRR